MIVDSGIARRGEIPGHKAGLNKDVRARNKNEFEACLRYLRNFMEAVDVDDVKTIQELRTQRNSFANNLTSRLPDHRLNELLRV